MKLYLIQHGEATSKDLNPQRPLTEKGTQDVKKVSVFLKQANININTISHSGKKRARETASILANTLSPDRPPIQKDGLAPNDPIDNIYKEILEKDKDLMIVGHLPHLARLASKLLLDAEDKYIIEFKPGSVLLLEKLQENWKVAWFIIPELL